MIATTGNYKHFLIAAFILAGITVVVVNAYLMANFLERPLAKRSENLQRIILKWEQFMKTTDSVSRDLADGTSLENALDHPEPTLQPKDQAANQPISSLPVLTGVLQVLDVNKSPGFIAIMEGKRLKKHDQIKDFTIADITAKGVVLSKNGQTWFVPTPNVFFSLQRKEETGGSKSR
jgi:hypothetical protein